MKSEIGQDLPFPVLPGGTVTFLFTDIEGSTKLLKRLREEYSTVLEEHRTILNDAFLAHGGHVVDTRGEEFFVAFPRATDAVAAAVEAQCELSTHTWPEEIEVRVRMGLHTGEPWLTEERYVGMDVHRAARIANVGHGGQVLLSETTAALAMDELPEGVTLVDLGRHRLKDVPRMEHIRQLAIDGLPHEFPPLKSLEVQAPAAPGDEVPNNLPAELTPFIGRDDELATIKDQLRDPSVHLLTLTGMGGIGKTRLALRVAADLKEDYPDGVWLVEFAKLRDPELVPQHTAAALRVSAHDTLEGQDVAEVFANYIRTKKLLLVFDNCEHLIEACAELAERLLRECPQVQLLATSRENLGVRGEYKFSVPVMDIPPEMPLIEDVETNEAASFFIDRASAASPLFKPSPENLRSIVEICQRLDGIPLAIELAAARIKILSPEQIAELLHDRFRVLTGGPRTALPRHQALHATLEWSYNLLTEPEQQLFIKLSVFSGGWTLEDVEGLFAEDAISRASLLEVLSHLVDKSLVTVSLREGATRYGMLETVREYASELLSLSGQTEDYRRKHATYFLAMAETGDPRLRSADQIVWVRKFEDAHENFRAALRWATTSDHADIAARLVGALGWFWFLRGYWIDARRWLTSTLDMRSDPAPLFKAKAICRAGGLELIQGNLAGPPDLVREALAIFEEFQDQEGMAWCLNLLGQLYTWADDEKHGPAILKQSLELFQGLGDDWGVAWSTRYLGQLAELEGDLDRAFALQEEALEGFEKIGDIWNAAHSLYLIGGTYRDSGDFVEAEKAFKKVYATCEMMEDHVMGAHALQGLGMAAHGLGRFDEAGIHLRGALEIMGRIGDENCTARVQSYLARVSHHEGDDDQALRYLRESIQGYQKLKRESYIGICLVQYAALAQSTGQHLRAARLLGAGFTLSAGSSSVASSIFHQDYDDQVIALRELLGEDNFELAHREGSSMNVEEAVAYAVGEGI